MSSPPDSLLETPDSPDSSLPEDEGASGASPSKPDPGPAKVDEPSRLRHGWKRRLLRIPLFYKILVANALALGLATGAGTWIAFNLGVSGTGPAPWILATGAATAGVLLATIFNAVVLRLALSPLSALERTASRIHASEVPEPTPVPDQPLADRDLQRLIRVFNDMIGRLARYRTRLRGLAIEALEAAEGERQRVARQLQDDTAQRLASLLVRIRLARRSENVDERNRLLDQLREETAETLHVVRRIARGLHPPELNEIGVERAIRAFVRGIQVSGGPEMELDLAPVEECLEEEARLALYRIVREAVSNVQAHARAEHAAVRIVREEARIVAEVVDDGVGFRSEAEDRHVPDGSLGLVGMRERALHVGGEVRISSRPGAGTRVRVELPCPRRNPAGRDVDPAGPAG